MKKNNVKTIKKKNKKMKLTFCGKCFIFLVMILFLRIVTNLFFGTITINEQIQIQKTEREIARLKEENYKLQMEINTLTSRERIYELASVTNLEQNWENVINIVEEE